MYPLIYPSIENYRSSYQCTEASVSCLAIGHQGLVSLWRICKISYVQAL